MAQGHIFLDTTVAVDRSLSSQKKKHRLQKHLNGKVLCTAAYVLGEFKQTFLKDLVYLYRLVYESDDLGEAMLRFEEFFWSRTESRLAKLFGNLLKELTAEGANKDTALICLDMWLEGVLVDRFLDGLEQPLADNCRCQKALAEPNQSGELWDLDLETACPEQGDPCCLVLDVVANNRAYFEGIVKLGGRRGKYVENILTSRPSPLGRVR